MKALAELRNYVRGLIKDCRARRDYRTTLEGEAMQDIAAEAAAEQMRAGDRAYKAQQADIEAKRILRAAQHPDSPGGRNITPEEAAPALRNIDRSADDDGEITEMLA